MFCVSASITQLAVSAAAMALTSLPEATLLLPGAVLLCMNAEGCLPAAAQSALLQGCGGASAAVAAQALADAVAALLCLPRANYSSHARPPGATAEYVSQRDDAITRCLSRLLGFADAPLTPEPTRSFVADRLLASRRKPAAARPCCLPQSRPLHTYGGRARTYQPETMPYPGKRAIRIPARVRAPPPMLVMSACSRRTLLTCHPRGIRHRQSRPQQQGNCTWPGWLGLPEAFRSRTSHFSRKRVLLPAVVLVEPAPPYFTPLVMLIALRRLPLPWQCGGSSLPGCHGRIDALGARVAVCPQRLADATQVRARAFARVLRDAVGLRKFVVLTAMLTCPGLPASAAFLPSLLPSGQCFCAACACRSLSFRPRVVAAVGWRLSRPRACPRCDLCRSKPAP